MNRPDPKRHIPRASGAPRSPNRPKISQPKGVSTSRTGRREGHRSTGSGSPNPAAARGSGGLGRSRKGRGEALINDSDFPAAEDKLGFTKSAEKFAALLERVEAPLTILLDGEAGAGRSSYMRFIAGQLEQSNVLVPLWTEAPIFDDNGVILSGVLSKLCRFGQNATLNELALRFLTHYSYNAEHPGFLPELTGTARDLENLRRHVEYNLREEPHGINLFSIVETMQDAFLHFIQTALGQGGRRFFLSFVDDLDSCKAETVDRFLYDMFTFTALPNSRIVWVFSMNRRAYEERRGQAGIDFLNKIVNLNVRVPTARSVRALITQYVSSLGLIELKGMVNQINDLFDHLKVTNPRSIKRIVSRIGYCRSYGQVPKNQQELALFCALTLLFETYPKFFDDVFKNPAGGLLVFASAGSSYGQSKFNATTLAPMLKPLKRPYEKELEEDLFVQVVGYVGQLVGKVYGVRTGNVSEAINRFRPLMLNVLQIF
jgi:hypothetical protein